MLLIVATDVVLLLHAPSMVVSAKIVVKPMHVDGIPVTGPTFDVEFTVTISVAIALPQVFVAV